MKTFRVLIGMTAAALLTACGSRPTPVPVIAPLSDMSALVGDWSGEYSSPETGRTGSIAFTLKAGKDTAVGGVVMLPRAPGETSFPTADKPVVKTSPAETSGDLLTIRFVRIEGGKVVGVLDPYRDPDCGCQLTTTFRGEFKDPGTIEGTFDTTGSAMGHLPTSGRWKVTRVAE